ncbi:unnamed protein product [Owenia fusiformis]|uniref:Uncharacterized protein n=1 Tax=Owenia fusiformis TaxID=6347 RepID=A0A8J1TU21_OWEFU|nr:unnamed protein product [Owenia fusiformis]
MEHLNPKEASIAKIIHNADERPAVDSMENVDDSLHDTKECADAINKTIHEENPSTSNDQMKTNIEMKGSQGTDPSCNDVKMDASGFTEISEISERASNDTKPTLDVENDCANITPDENCIPPAAKHDNSDIEETEMRLSNDVVRNSGEEVNTKEMEGKVVCSEVDNKALLKQEPEIETDEDLYQQPKRSRKSRKSNKPMRIIATVADDEASAYISDDDCDINDDLSAGIKGSTVGIIAKVGLEVVKNTGKYWGDRPVKQMSGSVSGIKLAYSCKECKYTTDNKSHLHRHMNAHTGYKPFVCFVCGLEYSRSEKVRWHVFRHHPNEQYDILKCKKDNLNKPSTSLSLKNFTKVKDIKEEANKGELPANEESKKQNTTSTTKATDNNLDKVVCKECGYKSNCAYSLSRHIKEVHQKVATFSCPLCDYGTNRRYRFINHMIKHGILQCCFCSHIASDQIGYECHLTACKVKTTSASFPCDHCTDTFTSKKQLSLHIGDNHQIYQFKCTQCDFKSNFQGLFQKHENKHTKRKIGRPVKLKVKLPTHNLSTSDHETEEGGIKCELCDVHLKNNHSYLKHKRQAHSGSKPYACHECDFETESEIALMNHLRIHTGTKLPCYDTDCTYKSSFSGSLARHMAEVHEIVPRHLCPLCPKDFRCQTKLYYHLQVHNEAFTCLKCDSKFYLDAAYKMHQEVCEGPISRTRFNPSLDFNDLNENKTSMSPIL